MTTYIIKKREFSEKALRRLGNGNVWKPVAKTKVRPPQTEREFHQWLLDLVEKEGVYHIIRNQEKGESAGFKPVCLCEITEDRIFIHRGYSRIKSNPGFKSDRQAYFKNVPSRSPFRRKIR